MNKAAMVIPFVVILILVGVGVTVAILRRDEPPPDTRDLVLERTPVADEDNAWTEFRKASEVYREPAKSDRLSEILDGTVRDDRFADDLIATNSEALRLIEDGCRRRVCRTEPQVLRYDTLLPYLRPWRDIARVMVLKAMRERETGQLAAAARTVVTLCRFGDMIQKDANSLVHDLLGGIILVYGLEQVKSLALEPTVSAEVFKELSDMLCQLGPLDKSFARAFKGEYQAMTNLVEDVHSGRIGIDTLGGSCPEGRRTRWGRPFSFMLQPNKTNRMFAEYHREMIRNASHPYAEMTHDSEHIRDLVFRTKNWIPFLVWSNSLGLITYTLMVPAVGKMMDVHYRSECILAVTRVMVACKLYEKEQGTLPQSLDALVPKYLDSVPIDPYDGKPLRYDRERKIIYSVGRDLQDSGGSTQLPPKFTTPTAHDRLWNAKDIVFRLDRSTEDEK